MLFPSRISSVLVLALVGGASALLLPSFASAKEEMIADRFDADARESVARSLTDQGVAVQPANVQIVRDKSRYPALRTHSGTARLAWVVKLSDGNISGRVKMKGDYGRNGTNKAYSRGFQVLSERSPTASVDRLIPALQTASRVVDMAKSLGYVAKGRYMRNRFVPWIERSDVQTSYDANGLKWKVRVGTGDGGERVLRGSARADHSLGSEPARSVNITVTSNRRVLKSVITGKGKQ